MCHSHFTCLWFPCLDNCWKKFAKLGDKVSYILIILPGKLFSKTASVSLSYIKTLIKHGFCLFYLELLKMIWWLNIIFVIVSKLDWSCEQELWNWKSMCWVGSWSRSLKSVSESLKMVDHFRSASFQWLKTSTGLRFRSHVHYRHPYRQCDEAGAMFIFTSVVVISFNPSNVKLLFWTRVTINETVL